MPHPFPQTWWIDPGKILGGCYPGTLNPTESLARLQSLVSAGIRVFINLQEPNEIGRNGKSFPDYTTSLQAIATTLGTRIECHRFPINDRTAPTVQQMEQIQQLLRTSIQSGKRVYIHCWGGHGRTGTVAGCWLVSQGLTPEEALSTMKSRRQHDTRCAAECAPQEDSQRDFIRNWARARPADPAP